MARDSRRSRLAAPAPSGWGWVRLSTGLTIVSALFTALLSVVAALMELAEKSSETITRLLLWFLVFTVLGLLTTVAGRLAEGRMRRLRLDQEWQATVERLLAEGPRQGRLPRLSEVSDVALGPTPTRYSEIGAAPYVARPYADGRLQEALAVSGPPFPFVVVFGDAKAGKSRTAVEAARAALGDPSIIIPTDGEALAELARLDPPLPIDRVPALVWLDDLTVADLNHLTGPVIDELVEGTVVVGTITSSRYWEILRTGSVVGATARAALRRAQRIELAFQLTAQELNEARHLYPNEQIDVSIGESLVGGEELVIKLRAGTSENPAGQALVWAAVDWRRVGIAGPITESQLRQLFPVYLRGIRSDLPPTTEAFMAGLAWACEPVASQVALLRKAPQVDSAACWDVLDYIVAVEDGQGDHPARPVPDAVWTEILAIVQPEQAYGVGITAHQQGRIDTATSAFRLATRSSDVAPWARFSLGQLLVEQRDPEGARAAFQQAIDSGHPDAAPKAATNLGYLLAKQGDVNGARQVYQLAIESANPDAAPMAAFSLGVLLATHGHVEAARAAYQQAIDSGHPDAAPMAATNLGRLLAKQGDVNGARQAFQLAIDSGHPQQALKASLNLSRLLAEHRDVEE